MRRQTEHQPQWNSQHSSASPDRRSEAWEREDLHVRNYDHRWGYDLCIEARDDSDEVLLEKRYYLQPGQVESEVGVLPHGDYEIRVTLDNLREEVLHCRIDADPSNTAVIEVGNGALSLTEGLHS